MRTLASLAVVVVAFATSCAADELRGPPRAGTQAPPAPGGPSIPPPTLEIEGPPAAWIETEHGKRWLAYATYCWGTACADYIAPSCRNERHSPHIVVERGEVVRFHLAFEPESVALRFFARGRDSTDIRLAPARVPVWEVDRQGAFWIGAAKHGGEDANYAGCFRFANGSAG